MQRRHAQWFSTLTATRNIVYGLGVQDGDERTNGRKGRGLADGSISDFPYNRGVN